MSLIDRIISQVLKGIATSLIALIVYGIWAISEPAAPMGVKLFFGLLATGVLITIWETEIHNLFYRY